MKTEAIRRTEVKKKSGCEKMKNESQKKDNIETNNSENTVSKTSEKKKKRKSHNFLYLLIVSAILFAGVSAIYIEYGKTIELNKRDAEILKEIENQNKITEKINNQQNYYDSDEYVEKIAREQLSLVKPNEILFIDLDK